MPLVNVVLTLIVVGVLLWLVNRYIPMQSTIKGILNAVVVIAVVLSVALIRLLDVYVFPGRVWASYGLVALLFVIVGLVAWRKRTAGPGDESP